MNSELKRNYQYCNRCEIYYLDVLEETCRCPALFTDEEEKIELSAKRLADEATL